MAIRTRVRRRRRRYTALPLLALATLGAWWALAWMDPWPGSTETVLGGAPQIASHRPEIPEALPPQSDVSEKGAETPPIAPVEVSDASSQASHASPPARRSRDRGGAEPADEPSVDGSGDNAGTRVAAPPTLMAADDRPGAAKEATASRPGPTNRATEKPAEGLAADTDRVTSLIAAGKQALSRGDLLAARTHYSDALQLGPGASETTTLRAELSRLGQETILSPKMIDGDPHVGRYIVKPGDSLAKIAALHKVPADLLAAINGIADKNLIRAGQTLKVVKGPFHAFVDKGDYTLDVYLDRTFVRAFRVGLGLDNSTPTGLWQVDTKLVNPTYYPPRGGQIISADDPQNPLGERWIALKGIDGEALGQERYGIHGTNEPNSIGRSVSLGCVRMYNEDVEALYSYLVEKHSTVTIVE